MSDDIENTINNFLIEAAAMRAALDEQGRRVEQLTSAIQKAAAETKSTRNTIQMFVEDRVHHVMAEKVAKAIEPFAKSIRDAAASAEASMVDKLEKVEQSHTARWLIYSFITLACAALAASFTAALLTIFRLVR